MKFLISILLFLLTIALFSQEFKSQKLTVFKNGLGFFIKSGDVEVKNKTVLLKNVPEAAFGTLWVESSTDKIKSVVKVQKESLDKKQVLVIKDVLSANINKKLKLALVSGEIYDATILSLTETFVTIKAGERWLSVFIYNIKSVEYLSEPSLEYQDKGTVSQLQLTFDKDGKKNVNLMYLQKNIGWMPSYLIKISNDKTAEVTLSSTLINDAEDINDAEVEFVVGVPNFKYNHILSPMVSNESLQTFLAYFSAGSSHNYNNNFDNYYGNSMSNVQTQQRVNPRHERLSSNAGSASVSSYDANAVAEFTTAQGGSEEDLYFYKQKNVTLKKGERGTFELMTAKISYEHIYDVDLPVNGIDNVNNTASSNKVWHSIKLKNNTSLPWTTGSVMIIKSQDGTIKPISQDIMYYTPVKSDSYIKITVTPDVFVNSEDKELKRTQKVKKINYYNYDLVNVEGKIKVKNYKSEDIKLSIKRNVTGMMKISNLKWNFTPLLKTQYGNANQTNDVHWEVELKKGEEKEITYTYDMYMINYAY